MQYLMFVLSLLLFLPIPGHAEGNVCTVEWGWTVPTTRADGSALTDLAGYRLYQGTDPDTHVQIAQVPKGTETFAQVVPQTDEIQRLYSVVTAVDQRGKESGPSNEVMVEIPPAPPAQWDTVDIRAYGAIPNDSTNDTHAIRNAIEAINNAGGGTVYFPEGTWDAWDIPLTATDTSTGAPQLSKPPQHISLIGAGRDKTLVKRIPYVQNPSIDQRRLMTVQGADDVTIADMAMDMNGVAKYSGMAFYNTKDVTILRTRVYDSNPQPYDFHEDIYAYVFGFGGEIHANLIFVDNVIETLGVEIDNIDGAWISGNTFKACRSTTCVGSFMLASNRTVRNMQFVGNTIIDPVKAGMLVGWDRVVMNTSFEHITFLNNTVQYTAEKTTPAIRIGAHDNSQPTTGNSMHNVRIEGNSISVAPGVPTSPAPLIFGNNSPTANILFTDVVVRHNRLYSSTDRRFVDLREGTRESTGMAYDNLRLGGAEANPPPTMPLVAINVGGPEYVDAEGLRYEADRAFAGGRPHLTGETASIAGTEDDRLYATQRESQLGASFSYHIPLPNGGYVLTLKFAEKEARAVGERIFDVMVEGHIMTTQLDLRATAGRLRAYEVTVPIAITDGQIDIQMIPSKGKAVLSAIVIRRHAEAESEG